MYAIKSPEIDPHKDKKLSFDGEARAIKREKIVFSTHGVAITGRPPSKK